MNSKDLANDGFNMALPDGESVWIRPVRPSDGPLLQNGMASLSPQSRLFRFFSPISKLSDEQLHYFTEVDQHNHVAWIALSQKQPEPSGLGIARFIRLQDKPNVAEFAIVIIDSYQQRGLGCILMSLLYTLAIGKDIEILRAVILPENTVMSSWLARLGAVGEYSNGCYSMNLKLPRDFSSLTLLAQQRLKENITKIAGYLSLNQSLCQPIVL